MKKSLLALALLGAFAGVAQAQTAVQIYGTVDAGIIKRTDQTLAIGKRANNTLGFKGTEELGNGLKALFQLEIRYEPDTGTHREGAGGVQRPLFQGQSRVGLQGDFGMVRLGRGLTAFQESEHRLRAIPRRANASRLPDRPDRGRLHLGSTGHRRATRPTVSRTRCSTTRQNSAASRSTPPSPPKKPTAASPSSAAAPQQRHSTQPAPKRRPTRSRSRPPTRTAQSALMLAYERNAVETSCGRSPVRCSLRLS